MPRIFISHSSKNVKESNKIKEWLNSNGFELSFLDYDNESGIPVGGDWERVLYDEIERSQAVIIILTPDWQASKWCFSEYTQARALGKAIYPLMFVKFESKQISDSIQHLDLTNDPQEAYEQLLRELTTSALNTQEGFEWDITRPPYPGMLSFEEEDAAIFFGRDDDILRIIERLNARSAQGGSRLLVLLGASGSGKSSLLKAGVLPRLRRDQRHWIILPIFRPKLRPVRELAITLATMLDEMGMVNDYYQQLLGENVTDFLTEMADKLQQQAKQIDATILISVDQSEELFSTAETKEAEQLFNIITLLKYKGSPWLCIFTLRSDFLGYLQNAECLKTDFTEISLKPMPLSRIDRIIRGPAKVVGLKIDPELIAVATEDAKTRDALPLLAFALRQLYERFGDDGDLTLDEYQRLGDEKKDLNPLENAVSKAADDALQQSKPDQQTHRALREAFIPAMVRVNDQGEYVRRPANWDELPAKALPLLEQLAKARLLTIKQKGDSKMVEVSHEALLRKWPLLQTWLSEEHEFLVGKDQLERSLQDWQNSDSKDKKQALLQGLPLIRAQQWLLDHPNQLNQVEREYIKASTRYKEQQQKRIRNGLTVFILALIAVAGFALIQWQSAVKSQEIAKNKTLEAKQQLVRTLIRSGVDNSRQGRPQRGLHDLLSAYQEARELGAPNLARSARMLMAGWSPERMPLNHGSRILWVGFGLNGERVITIDHNSARIWDAKDGRPVGNAISHEGFGEDNVVPPDVVLSPRRDIMATRNGNDEIQLCRLSDGRTCAPSMPHPRVATAVFSADSRLLATGGWDQHIRLWEVATGKLVATIRTEKEVFALSFNEDATLLLAGCGHRGDGYAQVWDVKSRSRLGKPVRDDPGRKLQTPVRVVAFSPDGKTFLAGDERRARLWDITSGQLLGEPMWYSNGQRPDSLSYTPDGSGIVAKKDGYIYQFWDAASQVEVSYAASLNIRGDARSTYTDFVAYSPDGKKILTIKNSVNSYARDGATKVLAGEVYIRDAETGTTIGSTMSHEGDEVVYASFSDSGEFVVTLTGSGVARLWCPNTGFPVSGPLRDAYYVRSKVPRASEARVRERAPVAFGPRGDRLVTGGPAHASLWNTAPSEPLGLLGYDESLSNDELTTARFATESGTVLSHATSTRFWDIETGLLKREPLESRLEGKIIGISDDGATVVEVDKDRTIRLRRVATAEEIGLLGVASRYGKPKATFRDDAARVAVFDYEQNLVHLWNSTTGAAIGAPLQHKDGVRKVEFGPQDAVVTMTWDDTLRLWDATTGQPRSAPMPHKDDVVFDFDADHSILITGSGTDKRGKVEFWNLRTGTRIKNKALEIQGIPVALRFSPDGARIAVVYERLRTSDNGILQVWDAEKSERIGDSLSPVDFAVFSPDSKVIAAIANNYSGAVQFLDSLTLHPIAEPRFRVVRGSWGDPNQGLSFSPDGALLMTHLGRHAEVWSTISPLPDAPRVLQLWIELQTGRQRDTDGVLRQLGHEDWLARREELDSLEGPPVSFSRRTANQKAAFFVRQARVFVGQQRFQDAMNALAEVRRVDPKFHIPAQDWHQLCLQGSLSGYAPDVLVACEQAVQIVPNSASFRDSRGLSRALTGDSTGAIEDFEFFIRKGGHRISSRRQWVASLKKGENPFTEDVLKKLSSRY